jgi:hypothetical protein
MVANQQRKTIKTALMLALRAVTGSRMAHHDITRWTFLVLEKNWD